MKQRFKCKSCGHNYKQLGPKDKCFHCDYDGWKKWFYPRDDKK